MTDSHFFTTSLNCMLATTCMDAVTPDDVAYTLAGHSAFESVRYPSPAERTVDVTRADGEIMRVILDYDPETCEPAGWTTAQGPSVDELQSEDGGASDDPEQVVRDLHAAVFAWLDRCDT